jgi:hypothetical protein
MVQGPNAVRLGVVPSSCQVIVEDWPAAMEVEAVGEVIKTVA